MRVVRSSYSSNILACKFAFHELKYLEASIKGERWMRVISKTRLRRFWESAGNTDSQGPLRAWHSHVSHRCVAWQSWSDVKIVFGSASLVGNCVVFNIGGNKYRLVTRILYPSQKVFILKVMTHAQYDQDKWKEDCGCYEPPPQKPKKQGK
jgi:mRNA interferase HigB